MTRSARTAPQPARPTRRSRHPRPLAVAPLLALVALAAALPACARRTIEITSEPPGALVWLNDQQLGRTPVRTGFTHYGVYDIRLSREGYEPIATSRHANAPIYELPGPDLLAAPFPIETRFAWHFVLDPVIEQRDPASAETTLRRRAEELRATSAAPTGAAPTAAPDNQPKPAAPQGSPAPTERQ
jgi:hypothetical protein